MTLEKKLKVIIDSRERKLMDTIEKNNKELGYEAEQLDVADVVISEKVACERKEGFDFIASIMDNRLFEQLIRLKETYQCPILILEGLNDDVLGGTGMKLSSIYGALAFISYKLGISVIPTRHLEDTALVIERIAYREQVKDKAPLLSRKAPKGMTIEERRAFIVEGLLDIGATKAKSLIQAFGTPYEVFKAIKKTKITYTKTGNPKAIEGPIKDSGLKGFGWKFIKLNKELLFNIYELFEENRSDDSIKQKTLF